MLITIAGDPGVLCAKKEILKSKLAPEFQSANPDATPATVFEFLVGKAAELAANDEAGGLASRRRSGTGQMDSAGPRLP